VKLASWFFLYKERGRSITVLVFGSEVGEMLKWHQRQSKLQLAWSRGEVFFQEKSEKFLIFAMLMIVRMIY
jgi:hypothetical protein